MGYKCHGNEKEPVNFPGCILLPILGLAHGRCSQKLDECIHKSETGRGEFESLQEIINYSPFLMSQSVSFKE